MFREESERLRWWRHPPPPQPPRLYYGFRIKIPEGRKKYEEFRVSKESRKERKNASVHSCHDIRVM